MSDPGRPALYVHCGFPRTGTSSLHAALAKSEARLAEFGVVYPDQWRPGKSDAHHGLADLLQAVASTADDAALDGLRDYMRSNADSEILISTEVLSNWLLAGKRSSLIRLLRAAREARSVKCLWTLRSADAWVTSMYLHMIAAGKPVPAPAEFFAGHADGIADAIAGLREVSDALGGSVSYSRYDRGGAHYGEILGSIGLPEPVRGEVLETLGAQRMNVGLSHKGAVALLNIEPIGERLGIELSRPALRAALRSEELRFAGDAPCELVDPGVRRAIHEEALRSARNAGFAPYVEFFEDHEIDSRPAVSLAADVLTEDDLQRLSTCFVSRAAERP